MSQWHINTKPKIGVALAAALVLAVFVPRLVTSGGRVGPAGAAVTLSVRVSGNHLVDGSGNVLELHGVDRSGTEYACIQGWGIFDGPSDAASVAAIASWHVNAVRVPLNEDCWLGINGVSSSYGGAAYQQAIVNYVNLLNQYGIYAILDLHWSAPGTTPATGQEPMPDQDHSPAFWTSVAETLKSNPAARFDLFNEPYPDNNTDTTAVWTCWEDGGSFAGVSYTAAGMQELVNTVRATGAPTWSCWAESNTRGRSTSGPRTSQPIPPVSWPPASTTTTLAVASPPVAGAPRWRRSGTCHS